MDWLDRLNDSLDYIESSLESEISYEKAARLACMSVYHFQRMFPYIAGVPLSEYLRHRRMTKAAFELQNGAKVLDVALRCGYESPTAFNRAFRSVHGVSPSAARKTGVSLKAYPRISFQITIKGEAEMEFKIVKKEAFRVVGIREPLVLGVSNYKTAENMSVADVEGAFKRVPAFWQEAAQSGQMARICEMISGKPPAGLLGMTDCRGNESGKSWYYMAAVTDEPAPEDMVETTVPALTWAVFPGEGAPSSIQDLMRRIYAEWLPASGYEWADGPDIEVYLDDNPVHMHYEVWLPITKKA